MVNSKDNILFGKAIKEFRREAGFSQEDLADKANLDRTYISLIERGQRSPTVRAVIAICDAMDLPAATLFNRLDELRRQQQAQ